MAAWLHPGSIAERVTTSRVRGCVVGGSFVLCLGNLAGGAFEDSLTSNKSACGTCVLAFFDVLVADLNHPGAIAEGNTASSNTFVFGRGHFTSVTLKNGLSSHALFGVTCSVACDGGVFVTAFLHVRSKSVGDTTSGACGLRCVLWLADFTGLLASMLDHTVPTRKVRDQSLLAVFCHDISTLAFVLAVSVVFQLGKFEGGSQQSCSPGSYIFDIIGRGIEALMECMLRSNKTKWLMSVAFAVSLRAQKFVFISRRKRGEYGDG